MRQKKKKEEVMISIAENRHKESGLPGTSFLCQYRFSIKTALFLQRFWVGINPSKEHRIQITS